MKVEFQQVLRTRIPIRTDGKQIPTRTRVVAMAKRVEPGRVKVQVRDPNHKELDGFRFVVKATALQGTRRGRPRIEA